MSAATPTGAPTDLRSTVEYVRGHEKELRLFNLETGDPLAAALGTYFESQNVRIIEQATASGAPAGIAVLSSAAEVLSVLRVSTLRELVNELPRGGDGLGIADRTYERVLGPLKETTFTSADTEQLLYASREIEDRARRLGRGELHAGFQRCSVMADQRAIYRDLAGRGVSVHTYGIPDVTPPDLGTAEVHAVRTAEIADTWFVVFDGGGHEAQKSALLAQERDVNEFYGFWTYDPGLVDTVLAHLADTYRAAGPG